MKKLLLPLVCFLFLSLALLPLSASAKTADDFSDLKNVSADTKAKLDSLIQDGVFSGISDTQFGLQDKMDRAQFAKVAAIIFKLPIDQTLTTASFTDVGSSHWAFPYVEALKKAGLTDGYDATGKTYHPSGQVSRQELATFLIRGLGLDAAAKSAKPVADSTVSDWAKGYVSLALEKKLMTNLPGGTFGGGEPATREMLALASYEAKALFAAGSGTNEPAPQPQTPPATEPEQPQQPEQPQKPSEPGNVSVSGKKVLLISGERSNELAPDDLPIVNRLEDLGFTVDRLLDRKMGPQSFDGYDLIFISETVNSKYAKNNIHVLKTLPIPIIYNKGISIGEAGMSKISENSSAKKEQTITITDPDHPLAAGLKGDVDVYYAANDIAFGIPGDDAIVVATLKSDSNKATIFAYEKGAKNVDGDAVPARTVFFMAKGGMLKDNATEELMEILEAAALWAVQ